MMTLTIEIPALDRLCDILEERQRGTIIKELKDEIVSRLKAAAEGGVPKPEFEEVTPAEDHPWKGEATTAPEPREAAQEPPKPEPTNAPVETAAPTTPAKPERPEGAEGASAAKQDAPETRGQANGAARGAIVTLEAIQLAAAQMRDQGKLKAVTDLFPEFGIKKLSDLKGEKLQAFGERLRAMGARV